MAETWFPASPAEFNPAMCSINPLTAGYYHTVTQNEEINILFENSPSLSSLYAKQRLDTFPVD